MARRKRFTAEFKRQALRRADEPGMTDALVCEELTRLRRELAEVTEERDFLRAAARYFARESR